MKWVKRNQRDWVNLDTVVSIFRGNEGSHHNLENDEVSFGPVANSEGAEIIVEYVGGFGTAYPIDREQGKFWLSIMDGFEDSLPKE